MTMRFAGCIGLKTSLWPRGTVLSDPGRPARVRDQKNTNTSGQVPAAGSRSVMKPPMDAARRRSQLKRGEHDDLTAVWCRERCGLAGPGDGGGVHYLSGQPDPVP